jgi:hypothetical protein
MLEEFSDSLTSLNWENVYAKKIEFKTAVEESLVAENSDQNEALNGSDSESSLGEREGESDGDGDGEPVEDENAVADDSPVDLEDELDDVDTDAEEEDVGTAAPEAVDDDASETTPSI